MSDDIAQQYRPASGTHNDVFIYEDLYTIGVYYPSEQVDPQETLYGSSIFFFDYDEAMVRFREGMQNGLDDRKIKMSFSSESAKNRYEGESAQNIDASAVYDLDKFLMMLEEWGKYLIAMKNRPAVTLFSEEAEAYQLHNYFDPKHVAMYREIRSFDTPESSLALDVFMPLTKEILNGVYGFEIGENYRQGVQRAGNRFTEITMKHPLTHFPPLMPQYNMLSQTVFWDPENAGVYYQKILSMYGPQMGQVVASAFARRNQKVLYSDIIKPAGYHGYSVIIDFRPFDLPYFYAVNWEDFRLEFDFIRRFSGIAYNEWYQNHPTGWISLPLRDAFVRTNRSTGVTRDLLDNKKVRADLEMNGINPDLKDFVIDFPYYDYSIHKGTGFSSLYDVAITHWKKRDDWMQNWLRGGVIPLTQFNIYQGIDMERRYPVRFLEKRPDILRQVVLKIVTITVTAVVAYYTGQMAQFGMSIAQNVMMKVIEKAIEKLNLPAAEFQMVSNIIISAALNKVHAESGGDKDKKVQKATDFLLNSLEVDLHAHGEYLRERERIQNEVRIFNDTVTANQQMILELIGRHRDQRYNSWLGYSGTTAMELMDNRVQQMAIKNPDVIQRAIGVREFGNDKQKKEAIEDIAKIGAAGVGLFALLKLLK